MSKRRAMSFDDRLAALSAETGGTIPVAEIGRVVASLLEGFDSDAARPDAEAGTADEIAALLEYVRQTKAEIAALQPAELTAERIPHANDQLRSVVSATEEATGVFLDIAEELEHLAETLPPSAADQLHSITTRIYEASNFQDITGQRINKVASTLGIIEERLARLVLLTAEVSVPVAAPTRAPMPAAADTELLNGPQLPDAAASQDDIDRLFASL